MHCASLILEIVEEEEEVILEEGVVGEHADKWDGAFDWKKTIKNSIEDETCMAMEIVLSLIKKNIGKCYLI